MSLTALQCQNAKPKNKPYKIHDVNGLYLEIYPHGKRHWRFRYTIHGKEKRISLGPFPEISLSEAREKVFEQRKLVVSGTDPSLLRQENKRQADYQASQTFELVAREWHALKCDSWSEGYARNIMHRFEADIFPVIGNIPVIDIKVPDVIVCLRKLEERNAHEMARKAQQNIGQVLRYSVQTGRVDRSFTHDLKGVLKGQKSTPFAAIEPDEIPELLKAIQMNKARLYQQTINGMLLLLLTFVRTSELVEAKWSEMDLEKREWIIPAARMKMKRDHVVPLSKQSVYILKQQKALRGKNEFVFPGISKPRQPMGKTTILKGLERVGYKGKMTGHGFRALAMTTLKEKLGYRHEVVDRQLAHYPNNKVDRAYDRTQFLDERKEMMQAWANYVYSLLRTCDP